MKNAAEIQDVQIEPRKKSDGWAAFLCMGTFMAAVGSASIIFNAAVDKMQDKDPMFVLPVAQQRIEDMGYNNVRFKTFNKAAEKPAEITFTAEKAVDGVGFVVFEGEANCNTRGCPKISVTPIGVIR
ncbi:MAG TPA: hypothetical protein PLX33_11330 [Alphaproteobacteria bacterium]|nr:hypothetical protein [Alphaproteobacteria bacterium]